MAPFYGLRVQAGASFYLELEYKDDDGELFDFTGWTAAGQIRQTPQAELALELTLDIDTETSIITISMTPEETSSLTLDKYVWAIELTETATGEVIRLIEGTVRVSQEIVYA